MKKNMIIKNLVAPSVLTLTGILAVSCSKNKDVPPLETETKLTFNYFVENNGKVNKIFDEKKWEGKKISDNIDSNFIESTILKNDEYDVEIKKDASNPNKWIFKNVDLNFVSFLYRYKKKIDTSSKKGWLLQTVYFKNKDQSLSIESMEIDEYWKLAEEKGGSNSSYPSELKKYNDSFYESMLTDPDDSNYKVYPSMQQSGINFITSPYFIAKEKFDEIIKKDKVVVSFFPENYNKNSEYIWKTNLAISGKPGTIGTVQYLTKGLKILKISKNNKNYIKFIFAKESIKVTLNSQDYFNDDQVDFYINVSNWLKK